MNLPKIVSRDEWLGARKELLAKEKEATRARDALNAERRELPMVKLDKDHLFKGPDGPVTLTGLFRGRRQLIVQHVMFDPEWESGCPSCSYAVADLGPGHLPHLHDKDTSFVVVSWAPLEKLEAWKAKKGWTVPWVSSFGSDFNYDFYVTIDEEVVPAEYNYRTKAEYVERGVRWDMRGENPGYSVFLRDGDAVFHTYSTFAPGVELLNSSTQFLDLTPLGRQEG
ncbi:MAG: FIG172199: hypothetical thioredoxin family protein [uncultured Truepera sp.]|uniref:FIG172199: hypothetical thioredoxin family protein n=1 Tax=uncultured Truepera sp. TaxID=543023 RepID=A0A6J4UZ86_9DEIN|nr:MAG: FIG172199: hypothetical thioredoxin family protein [uncultured Truepera sp.]